ncbi:MAG: molybdenum cofactor guanylyltransferase MobA [Alsobacter sp.]
MTTEPAAANAVLGVLLAGGLARRLGGGDKPLRAVGGRPILQRVIDTMAPQCAGLVLNANGDPARFGALGWPVVPDDIPGFAGPLAGILAALDHAARAWPQVTHVVSVAADSPFLPADLVARLEEGRKAAGADLACAASDGQSHPVIGLWPVALRAELRHALVVEDIRKIDRFTARYRVATVEWDTDPVDPFFNANTPEDVALADDLASRLAGL